MTRMFAVLAAGAIATSAAFSVAALAQQPSGQRVVGTIEKVDGNKLVVNTGKKGTLTVVLSPDAKITGVEKASLADVKPGMYIGSGAMPQPDGTQKAVEVHIFAENQRGTGEGFRPWAGAPHGSMTNGTVGNAVTKVGAGRLTVKYKGGEKTITVPPDTPVVRFVAGERSELKPGAHVSIFRAVKKPDGTLAADRISVGRGGVVPR